MKLLINLTASMTFLSVLGAATLVSQHVLAADYGLLIGVGKYQDKATNNLQGVPTSDAKKMGAFLEDVWKFDTASLHYLLDEAATKSAILDQLYQQIPAATQAGDRVVIYFAGHGSQVPDTSGDESDGRDETLVPYDYSPFNPRTTQIIDDDIAAAMNALKGREVTLIIDSCHSGSISRGGIEKSEDLQDTGTMARTITGPPLPEDPMSAARSGGYDPIFVPEIAGQATWTASTHYQVSWQDLEKGIFTDAFIELLSTNASDINGDGKTMPAELLQSLRAVAEDWCKHDPDCTAKGYGFTPTVEASSDRMRTPLVPLRQSQVPPIESFSSPAQSPVEEAMQLDLAMLPSASVRLGDEIRFQINFEGADEAYLYVFDLNSEGAVQQLFPNGILEANQKLNLIRDGDQIRIPDAYYGFELTASEPVGQGYLVAIASSESLENSDVFDGLTDEEFPSGSDGNSLLSKLEIAMTKVSLSGNRPAAIKWTPSVVAYETVN